jgi:hypothetical protein
MSESHHTSKTNRPIQVNIEAAETTTDTITTSISHPQHTLIKYGNTEPAGDITSHQSDVAIEATAQTSAQIFDNTETDTVDQEITSLGEAIDDLQRQLSAISLQGHLYDLEHLKVPGFVDINAGDLDTDLKSETEDALQDSIIEGNLDQHCRKDELQWLSSPEGEALQQTASHSQIGLSLSTEQTSA